MAKLLSEDILVRSPTDAGSRRSSLTAFIPIGIALLGVAAIMAGGVSARDVRIAEETTVVDPITTGSIASEPKAQSVPGHEQEQH